MTPVIHTAADAPAVVEAGLSRCGLSLDREAALPRLEFAMATILSQRSYGRILLHIMAMVFDRQIRWHCAGIVREVMPCV
jgi:hypothetical protein